MMDSSILKEALRYLERGWSVIPIDRDKKTPCGMKWERYQHERADTQQIEKWFGANGPTKAWPGIAAIMGPVSGNLACRDFDDPRAYRVWQGECPDLAKRLPTVKTGRGYHVYFTPTLPARYQKFADGELRAGKGHYCILPPSIHEETGEAYRWLIPPGKTVPDADPSAFARCFADTVERGGVTERAESVETAQRTERIESSETTEGDCVGSQASPTMRVPCSLEEAIKLTLPTGPGQRHRLLFQFCRALKAMPEYHDTEALDLWDEFQAWFIRAEPFIRTKDQIVSWDEFCDGWDKVVFPIGENPMTVIVEAAKRREPPANVARYKSTGLDLLANICAEFQATVGNRPFHLSARVAGGLLGVDAMTAWRYLRRLVAEHLLVCDEKGQPGQNGKASRWRYLENGDGTECAV